MEKKSTKFILNSDWFLQRPIDMEHKEYILSSFLSKVEEALGRGEIYPYFTELSLHMASIGNYLKNGKYIVLKKEFSEIDDEIMLYDLKSKLCRKKFSESEKNELNKILKESHEKLLQYFSVCKGMWDFSFEATSIKLRKNRKNLSLNKSYVVYHDTFGEMYYIWEVDYIKDYETKNGSKIESKLLYQGNDKTFTEVIKKFSTTKSMDIPIFEVYSSHNLPLESNLLPLFKRKIHSYFTQTLP